MNLPTIIYILTGVASFLIVGIIAAFFQEKKGLKSESTADCQTEEKSNSIIYRASQQARELLVRAELTGIKEVARSKHDTQKLEASFEEHLNQLIERSSKHLEETTNKIENHYIKLFETTEQFVTRQIQDNQQRIINQLDLVTKEAEKTINTESQAARLELSKRMQAELDAAKQLVEEYKQKRMELIDQEIIHIVSETVKRALGKTLSPKDHGDLIYRALEQAKKDGFFMEK